MGDWIYLPAVGAAKARWLNLDRVELIWAGVDGCLTVDFSAESDDVRLPPGQSAALREILTERTERSR